MSKKDNQAKIEKLPNSEVKVNFSVPANEFEEFVQEAAKEFSKEMKVDGFRSGNIPYDVVEKQVGQEALLKEGAEKAVKKHYVNVVIDNKLDAIGQPKIELKKLAKGEDLEVEATVAVLPEIEMKGDWESEVKKINEKFNKEEVKVTDEDVQKELDYLADQRAQVVTVNREAKNGDQLELDFEVWKDGAPIEGGTAKKHQIILGQGKFIPGFEENLVGAKAGEKKEFNLKFPDEYHQKNLAGQEATFKVTVNLVQERKVPEINDEFASNIGKFKNLEELKENIRQGIEQEKKQKQDQQQKVEVIEKIVDQSEADLPQVLIDSELDRIKSELENEIANMGLNKEQYLSQLGTTEEKLTQQWKEKEAPRRVKAGLIMKKVSKDNDLEPTSKEVEERANSILQYYSSTQQIDESQLDMQKLYDTIKAEMRNEKALNHLASL